MAIKDITSKCWILALFVRDDGERFLLGDGGYEFTAKQLHFAANAMANDVVEVQGNDGYMLAGQVRRPSVQSFDGYIGDSATIGADVENLRQAFFKFFRKNFFYKVIYIFPDGSAIQRKRGFLVDAPVARELVQVYPQYHVALNFEDINYYYYDEDSSGDEIFGKSATISLNSVAQTGGLIWMAPGSQTISEEGTDILVSGTNFGGMLDEIQLKGDTEQETYSGKNLLNLATFVKGRIDNGNLGYASDTASITYTDDSITFVTAANYRGIASDFIPVNASTAYIFYSDSAISRYTDFYDSSKTWISRATSNPATTPSNCAYIRVSFQLSSAGTAVVNNPQFEAGSSATSFEPYVGGIPSPNPDYPQEVQTVTGTQTITITDGGEQSQAYTVSLGSIELCEIGDYQDYIYKSEGDWYLHKETGKYTFTGSEGWGTAGEAGSGYYGYWWGLSGNSIDILRSDPDYYMTHLKWRTYGSGVQENCYLVVGQTGRVSIILISNNSNFANVNSFKTWLASNPASFYYPLATPTDTQITNAALVSQLEAVAGGTTYAGSTRFTVNGNGNLAAVLMVKLEITGGGGVLWDGDGAEWEEGTPAYSVVAVDSIDNVYPVLTITGRTVNPVLTDVTTGMIFSYDGTITESQTLKVDMLNKTATLNGASVIGNVSGDWLYLAPGGNRITYTADNADAPSALVEWQEIVG